MHAASLYLHTVRIITTGENVPLRTLWKTTISERKKSNGLRKGTWSQRQMYSRLQKGDKGAYEDLAFCYYKGIGVEKNEDLMVYFYLKSEYGMSNTIYWVLLDIDPRQYLLLATKFFLSEESLSIWQMIFA